MIALKTLEPQAVALNAARRVVETVGRLAGQLTPVATVLGQRASDDELQASQIYLSVLDLANWAQRGEGFGERMDEEDADDSEAAEEFDHLFQSVVTTMSLSPFSVGHRGTPPIEELIFELDDKSDDPMSVVCVAGWARYLLSQGRRLNSSQVAALASLSREQVRTLSRNGELPTATEPTNKRGTEYLAKDVRRFLSGRGVQGF